MRQFIGSIVQFAILSAVIMTLIFLTVYMGPLFR